jgi:hypothetical protein
VPRFITLGRVGICLYADDHVPPHFHIRTPDGEAQVRIDSLEVIRGDLNQADLEIAMAWARQPGNREALMVEWMRLNERD